MKAVILAGGTRTSVESHLRPVIHAPRVLSAIFSSGIIADTSIAERFFVADWPEDRGAHELYIARRVDDLPPIVWIGDAAKGGMNPRKTPF